MKAKWTYKSLLILINLIACFFLGLIFIGSFSMNAEAEDALNSQQVLMRMIIYGIAVSLFFSIITFLLDMFFRKKVSLGRRYLAKHFMFQFFILLIIYALICLYVYFT